jgi:Uma2 family endonuclease
MLEPTGQVLTPEEYEALPPNSRRELVDGVVRLMATPTPCHQDVANALRNALSLHRPPELRVTGEVEVRLAAGLRRCPDVLVVRAVGYDRRVPRVDPTQVVLAVEVVGPGSESADRDVKPREYALAGIPHLWRVETDPEIEVHTFRLGDGASYFQTGRFARGDVIDAQGIRWAKITVSPPAEET